MVSHAVTVVEWTLQGATDDPVRTLRTAEACQTCGTPPEGNELDDKQTRNAEHGQSEGIGLKRELMSEILDLEINHSHNPAMPPPDMGNPARQ